MIEVQVKTITSGTWPLGSKGARSEGSPTASGTCSCSWGGFPNVRGPRQHLRALQGDRLHRARDTGHHGRRRRRGPASGLDTPGTPAPARGCELLELMQPGTSDTPTPCVTSGRHDWRGAHARSGRHAGATSGCALTTATAGDAGASRRPRPTSGARPQRAPVAREPRRSHVPSRDSAARFGPGRAST
jgi:hypothetical protein